MCCAIGRGGNLSTAASAAGCSRNRQAASKATAILRRQNASAATRRGRRAIALSTMRHAASRLRHQNRSADLVPQAPAIAADLHAVRLLPHLARRRAGAAGAGAGQLPGRHVPEKSQMQQLRRQASARGDRLRPEHNAALGSPSRRHVGRDAAPGPLPVGGLRAHRLRQQHAARSGGAGGGIRGGLSAAAIPGALPLRQVPGALARGQPAGAAGQLACPLVKRGFSEGKSNRKL